MMDLIIIVFFWLALICVKPFIDLTEDEVEHNNLNAPDFSVMVTNPDHNDRIEDVNAIHWQWAENILKKDTTKHYHPETNQIDSN
jgi:hypothetical protein